MTAQTRQEAWQTLQVMADAWMALRGGPEAIAERQRRRLAALVAHARAHSPYYAEACAHLPEGLDDLQALPPTNKRVLMARFDDWATDRAVTREAAAAFVADQAAIGTDFLGRYALWTTSGTTGDPAVLVHDRASIAVYMGLSAMRTLPSWRMGVKLAQRGMRTAGVYATGGHYLACAMTARRHRERPETRRNLKVFSVQAPLRAIAEGLQAYQPAMLGGYPSVLRLLADEQRAGRLAIHPLLVVSGGEALGPADRAAIAEAFGATVTNPYACSEAGIVASECAHGWQHVNADWTILEPVDAAYRPTPPGERSYTSLLTYLGNRLQPVIRYDLGDRLLTRADPCPCGNLLPAVQVEGRTNDVLLFRTPGGKLVPILPLAITSAFDETRVGRYQLVQTEPDTLMVRLTPRDAAWDEAAWAEVSGGVRAFLARHDLAHVAVRRADAPAAPEPGSGKFRLVWAAPGVAERVRGPASD
jgi:phenylacetate-coenzyme A ligase PaaK-like adenylate-forming protein